MIELFEEMLCGLVDMTDTAGKDRKMEKNINIFTSEITQHKARDALTELVEASSQLAVANALHVNRVTVHNWLHKSDIPYTAILAILYVYEKTPLK